MTLDTFLAKASTSTKRASIREIDCIGCTKCIAACPVDAILGSSKQMHTVIASECTGCELCIAPCPVDCIDMIEVSVKEDKSNHYRNRYLAREHRLQNEATQTRTHYSSAKQTALDKKAYIEAAMKRVKEKNPRKV